jgi:hypothetical protein
MTQLASITVDCRNKTGDKQNREQTGRSLFMIKPKRRRRNTSMVMVCGARPARQEILTTAFPFGKAVWKGCYAATGLEALIFEKVECTTSAASSFGEPSMVPASSLSTSLKLLRA